MEHEYYCKDCKGHNIEWKAWVNEFGEVTCNTKDDGETEVYCVDCADNTTALKKLSKENIKEIYYS